MSSAGQHAFPEPVSVPARDRGDGWRTDELPLHDRAAARRLEAAAAAGLPAHALMQRAGASVARLALAVAPHAERIWVAAGVGNNGGDGLEAAAHLQRAGRQVAVSLAAGSTLPPDAAAALACAQAAGVSIVDAAGPPTPLAAKDLALDALFGIGLSRPADGWALAGLHALNGGAAPVLAIDIPSGLDADTGHLVGEHAVRARWTLSLLTLKPGLFTAQGRDHAGEAWFDPIGVDAGAQPPVAALLRGTPAALWPRRRHAQHKGSFGDVWVVGGAAGMAGAATLAARSALVAGAGRVYLVPLDASGATFDALQPELMFRPIGALQDAATPLEQSTVVCGCGAGDAARASMPALLARAARLVLDADALNALALDPALVGLLAARAARGRPTVLTPHPLEAARLLASSSADVQADRLAAARELARRYRALIVLKGSGSVIADAAGACWINASGNASLATAGSGDVLAGWLGGLWSQGLAALDAVKLAVHSHGAAADHWQAGHAPGAPLVASELSRLLATLRDR